MAQYIAPNGKLIDGVLETCPARAHIHGIDEDGQPEYEGTTTVFWDDQRPELKNGQILYLCEDGKAWTFDQLTRLEDDIEQEARPQLEEADRQPESFLTLAQFMASGRDCDDIGHELGIDLEEATPRHGRIYDRGCYLTTLGEQWHLQLARSEHKGTREVMETVLYYQWYIGGAVETAPVCHQSATQALEAIRASIRRATGSLRPIPDLPFDLDVDFVKRLSAVTEDVLSSEIAYRTMAVLPDNIG